MAVKPRLGNASAPEAPASVRSRHGKPGSFPGKCVPKQGLGNEKKNTEFLTADGR